LWHMPSKYMLYGNDYKVKAIKGSFEGALRPRQAFNCRDR